MTDKAGFDENRNQHLKIDNVTLATTFVQIKAFNEILLRNQATILAKLTNEDSDLLYNSFKETINKEIADAVKLFE